MNKNSAKKIAETITNEQLLEMFDTAKSFISDWSKISTINKGMTKGTAWNILASDFNVKIYYNTIIKTNMIREFGEFLPKELKIEKKVKIVNYQLPVHQEPKFN